MSASTWNRIAKVVKKHDYRPSATARLMTAKHSCLLGVLIGDITHPFSNHLVKGIAQVCREGKYQILIGTSEYEPDAELNHIDRMIDMGVDGLILQPCGNPYVSIEKLNRAGIPVVCIDSNPEGLPSGSLPTTMRQPLTPSAPASSTATSRSFCSQQSLMF